MANECHCDTDNCEWVYPDGCLIYGITSPHGCMGPWLPDHEHGLITATQCWRCEDVVEFNPPAKTINEADERAGETCSCSKNKETQGE